MSGALELQVAALLVHLQRERDTSLQDLRQSTAHEVSVIAGAARQDARRRMRAAVAEKRERVAERCRQALAELDAARRRAGFEADRRAVEEALAELPRVLEARWQDPGTRRSWWVGALRVATLRLVGRDWHIQCGPGPPDPERAEITAAARSLGATVERLAPAAAAGIRIIAGVSVVDATVPGLLADRAAVAARFLATLAAKAQP